MKIKFSLLVALSALMVAGCAAYYSVFGLSQLFAGASLSIIIMASSLEFSKVVAVSLLQRFWGKLSKALRIYLSVGVFVLVCITSAGIYGFLSNAYQKTANKYEISEGQLATLNNKKSLFEKNISDNQGIINIKTKRLEQLNNLRTSQETRLDGASTNSNRSRARTDINSSNVEIQKLNIEIDGFNAKNASLLDSVNVYANKVIEEKSQSSSKSEIGPLKYLAQLTGYPMDKVVNWFILLLIFVFDPLAVALVVATNKIIELEKNEGVTEGVNIEEVKLDKKISEPEAVPKENGSEEPEWLQESELAESKLAEAEPEPRRLSEEESLAEAMHELTKVDEVVEAKEDPVKRQPIIPNGKIELQDIKEIKEKTNRGFSHNIPAPNNMIQRVTGDSRIK